MALKSLQLNERGNKQSDSSLSLPDVQKADSASTESASLNQSLTSLETISGERSGSREFQRDNVQEVFEGKNSFDKIAYFDPYTGVSWQRYFKMDVHGENRPFKRTGFLTQKEMKPERELPELSVTRKENLNVYYYSHGNLYRKDASLLGAFGFDIDGVDSESLKFLYGNGLLQMGDGSTQEYYGRAMLLGEQTGVVVLSPPPGSVPVFVPGDESSCTAGFAEPSAAPFATLGRGHHLLFVHPEKVFRLCKEHGIEPLTAFPEESVSGLTPHLDGYVYLVDRFNCRLRMQTVKVGNSITRYIFERYICYTLRWKTNAGLTSRVVEEWRPDPSIRINY